MRKMLLAPCLLAAVGCGHSETFTDAGPGGDAAQDDGGGDPIDASGAPDGSGERGAVTVHVTRLTGTGEADTAATVYFADADGTLVEMVTPDAQGDATGMIEDGGSVTVRFGDGIYPTFRSVMGAAIGDELWFGARADEGAGQMIVTVPSNAGAIRYYVTGPCMSSIQGAATTINVTLADGCAATRPLLAVADRGAQADQYIVIEEAMPVDEASFEMVGPWLDAVPGLSATVSGIPADVTSREIFGQYFAGGRHVHGLRGTLPAGEPSAATLSRPPGSYDAMTALINMSTATYGYQILVHVTPLPAAPLVIDATPTLPVLDPQGNGPGALTWTTTAGAADGIYISTYELGEKEQTVAEWAFIVPPGATSLTYPDLPDAPSTQLDVMMVTEVDLVDGYAAYRAHAGEGTWRGDTPVPVPAAYVQHIAYYF